MPSADIDLAISQFLKRLPAPEPADPVNMPSAVVAHVVARAATIRLCARTSPERTMDERAIRASLGCARMIHLLTISDYDMWTLDVVLVVSVMVYLAPSETVALTFEICVNSTFGPTAQRLLQATFRRVSIWVGVKKEHISALRWLPFWGEFPRLLSYSHLSVGALESGKY